MSASLPPSRDDNPLSANPDLHGQVIYYNPRVRVLDGQMTKALAVVGAVMVALMASRPATAAPEPAASDLAAIQQQLSALRADYNARITELETRLKAAEDRAARAEAVSQPASQTASAPPPTQIAEQAAPGEVVIADNAGAAEPAKTSSPCWAGSLATMGSRPAGWRRRRSSWKSAASCSAAIGSRQPTRIRTAPAPRPCFSTPAATSIPAPAGWPPCRTCTPKRTPG